MQRVYSLARITHPLSKGASNAYWLELSAVGKSTNHSRFTVASEFICSRLGSIIGLPIPPFALLQQKGKSQTWFASVDYRLTGEALPPIDPEECVKEFAELSTAIILFDIWIANTDRHAGNLNMNTAGKPPLLNVFDHSHALFSFDGPSRLGKLWNNFAITENSESGANRHCLIDVLDTPEFFKKWQRKLDMVPNFMIEDTCEMAMEAGILKAEERDATVGFLLHRRQKLATMIHDNRAEFKLIHEWPLDLPFGD
jgi:hypothetical protein